MPSWHGQNDAGTKDCAHQQHGSETGQAQDLSSKRTCHGVVVWECVGKILGNPHTSIISKSSPFDTRKHKDLVVVRCPKRVVVESIGGCSRGWGRCCLLFLFGPEGLHQLFLAHTKRQSSHMRAANIIWFFKPVFQ